jgi:hypothetical protein
MKRDLMTAYAMAGMDAAIEKMKGELAQLLKKRKALGGKMSKRLLEASRPVTEAASVVAGKVRKRRKRTAAERKAVSLRMKKYWAERRKGEK